MFSGESTRTGIRRTVLCSPEEVMMSVRRASVKRNKLANPVSKAKRNSVMYLSTVHRPRPSIETEYHQEAGSLPEHLVSAAHVLISNAVANSPVVIKA